MSLTKQIKADAGKWVTLYLSRPFITHCCDTHEDYKNYNVTGKVKEVDTGTVTLIDPADCKWTIVLDYIMCHVVEVEQKEIENSYRTSKSQRKTKEKLSVIKGGNLNGPH